MHWSSAAISISSPTGVSKDKTSELEKLDIKNIGGKGISKPMK